MSADTEIAEAFAFFAHSVNSALKAVERRLDNLEHAVGRLDPFFTLPNMDDIREEIEKKHGDKL